MHLHLTVMTFAMFGMEDLVYRANSHYFKTLDTAITIELDEKTARTNPGFFSPRPSAGS